MRLLPSRKDVPVFHLDATNKIDGVTFISFLFFLAVVLFDQGEWTASQETQEEAEDNTIKALKT